MRPSSFLRALALTESILAFGLLPPRAGAQALPAVRIASVERLQPGWVRVFLSATNAPAGASYTLTAQCDAKTNHKSIQTAQSNGVNLAFDIQVNTTWLVEHSLPAPCHITQIDVSMLANGHTQAGTELPLDLQMDLPLSLITLKNTPVNPAGAPVSLAPTTSYKAYPPLLVAVYSPVTKRTGLAEVEELPTRGTVGLRALSVFDQDKTLWRELGGGGEILPNWGLDINTLGIWRAPQSDVETSNPAHDVFPYQWPYGSPDFQLGTIEPPILAPAEQTPYLFPAPDSSAYNTYVLNNRGVRRCPTSPGCMDFTYDAKAHTLNAANGASIALVTPPAIQLGVQTPNAGVPGRFPIVIKTPLAGAATGLHTIDPVFAQKILATAQALANLPGRDLRVLEAMPSALNSSMAPMASDQSTRELSGEPESPEEAEVSKTPSRFPKGRPVGSSAAACVVNHAHNGVTSTPSGCLGLKGSPFPCPTLADPIRVESLLPPGPSAGLATALNGTIPPYYAGRTNVFGTCGDHALVQYKEALLDRYTDDLAVRRLVYVNGDAIVVPRPRVALSVTAALVQGYTWSNTHTGDPIPAVVKGLPGPRPTPAPVKPQWPDTEATQTNVTPHYGPVFPGFPEAYWAAREGDWNDWVERNGPLASPPCAASFWSHDGFCMGQGHPPIGAYYSYSQMVRNLGGDALTAPPWSVADSYLSFVETEISDALKDKDGGVQAVMTQIDGGLPVELSFEHATSKKTPDGSGGILLIYQKPTWYLPPELGGCDAKTLDPIFGPDKGHWVNIVGYWISGTAAAPDPFGSYFILENNWGKTQGYHSFNFMNFAAFRYLARRLLIYRLQGICRSLACAGQPPSPILPRGLLKQLQYPPEPGSPADAAYNEIISQASAEMAGAFGPSAQANKAAAPAQPAAPAAK